MSRHAAAAAAVAPAALASAALLLLMLAPAPAPGYALGCLAVAATALRHRPPHRPPELGTDLPPRLLVAAGTLAYAAGTPAGTAADQYSTAVLAGTGAVLLGVLLAEPLLRRLARPWYHAAHLPAPPAPPAVLVSNGTAWGVNSAAILLTGLVAVLAGPGWLLPLPALAAAGLAGWLLADGLRRWRSGHRAELARLAEALTAYQPRFLLYFSAPPGSTYQVRMWLPELARLDAPFLVVLAERHNLPAVAAATAAPVVGYETFQALDAVMVPSLRAAFYVNNGMKNAHCVRYTRLTHVQLYHGDSDKAVTASPVNQLYDRVFVAGQAAIDRFAAHGVDIPAERFRIVGRPQVAAALSMAAALPVAAGPPARGANPKVVLYAPTWVGAHADSDYCSLPIAEQIVAALLARGCTVIFRPHPYSAQDRASAARLRRVDQLLGADRTDQPGLFECMNRSDAMICDVSSVASDYLFTGKPFAITDVRDEGEQFTVRYPVARAAYRLRGDAGNLAAVLDDLLGADPRRPVRQQLRTYYLGDIPADRYAEAFLTHARECLTHDPESGV